MLRHLPDDALPFFSAAMRKAFRMAFSAAMRMASCLGCCLYFFLILFTLRQCPKYQSNTPFNDKYQRSISKRPQWGQRSGEV